MTNNELLTLAEREADRLTAENDHGAAIIMRDLCARLREATEEHKIVVTIDSRGRSLAAGDLMRPLGGDHRALACGGVIRPMQRR